MLVFFRMLYHFYRNIFKIISLLEVVVFQNVQSPLCVRIIHGGNAVKVKGDSPPSPLHTWNIVIKLKYK